MEPTENTGAAPAADAAPAPAEASQKPPPTQDGAAPAQLTPYQKRKAREAQLLAEAAARRAKREAAKSAGKGGKAKAADAPAAAQADEAADEWDEAQRRRETGGFWRLTLRIVGLVMWPFGYQLDALTDKECAEDVALLAPLASRHKWLEVCIRYAALPYLLVERIATKTKRRDPVKPPAGTVEASAK